MQRISTFSPSTRLLIFAAVLMPCAFAGCMNPGMNRGYGGYGGYGSPYAQPMYTPPQMINQGAVGNPGSLYIPESSAPAYVPSDSTYDSDSGIGNEIDGFNKADDENSPFYGDGEEGLAPLPRGRSIDDDLGVQFNPPANLDGAGRGMARPSSIQPVSATSAPMEYGFDTENYQWLRGILRYDDSLRQWWITYSPAARDRFGGRLILIGSRTQLEGFRDGDMIDVHGHVDMAHGGTDGRPGYHIDTIQRISM